LGVFLGEQGRTGDLNYNGSAVVAGARAAA